MDNHVYKSLNPRNATVERDSDHSFQMTMDSAIDNQIISRSASYVCMSLHQPIVVVGAPVDVHNYLLVRSPSLPIEEIAASTDLHYAHNESFSGNRV